MTMSFTKERIRLVVMSSLLYCSCWCHNHQNYEHHQSSSWTVTSLRSNSSCSLRSNSNINKHVANMLPYGLQSQGWRESNYSTCSSLSFNVCMPQPWFRCSDLLFAQACYCYFVPYWYVLLYCVCGRFALHCTARSSFLVRSGVFGERFAFNLNVT